MGNIYENWYREIRFNNTLNIYIRSKNEILDLQNFFLICQRAKREGVEGKFNLGIKCEDDMIFRIAHYLFLAKCCENVEKITINGIDIDKLGTVRFYKRIPLLMIRRDMYEFLNARLENIITCYGETNFFSNSMEEKIERHVLVNKKDDKALLLKLCLNNLIGEVDKGTTPYSKARRKYFFESDFYKEIKEAPFLACLIFSISIRAKNKEAIEIEKARIKELHGKKRVVIKEEQFEKLFLDKNSLQNEMFNAWDISDGVLQLIENIVIHAGGMSKDNPEKKIDGEGIFSMYLYKNEWKFEHNNTDKEMKEDVELYKNYQEYFEGYINEYKDGVYDERTNYERIKKEVLYQLGKDEQVEQTLYSEYDEIRQRLAKRRQERRSVEYFLEIQLTDYSGRNMCDVFRNNLKKRNDPNQDNFKHIKVRSFFDPCNSRIEEETGEIIDEIALWDKYYSGDNAIQHFGLQIFLSIISDNRGCFDVKTIGENDRTGDFYSNIGCNDNMPLMLPGTAYKILLPMKSFTRASDSKSAFLNADINYKFSKLEDLKPNDNTTRVVDKFFELLKVVSYKKDDKNVIIESLRELLREIPDDGKIIEFDCKKIEDSIQFELFVKTVILLIADARSNYNNIAIINCATNSFIRFIRYFSIYYDKNGNCDWMSKKQIYLCGEKSAEEFVISGRNIQEMIGRVKKLAFSRRLNSNYLPILTRMLQKRIDRAEGIIDKEDFSYTPFDLIIHNKNNETIFEQNVLSVLEENIQVLESGCKIEPTHMRIGSKVHMHAFYEAELLFFNNYYVNRFAYLLAERLNNMSIDWEKPIWFIGYEAYSEMLICKLKRYIEEGKRGKTLQIHYSIYENSRGSVSNLEENFRYFKHEEILDLLQRDVQVLFVVPINSTLTTFNKLEYIVQDKVKEIKSDAKFCVVGYLGIIQIRDLLKGTNDRTKMEEKYWDAIDLNLKCIISKKLLKSGNNTAYYLIITQAKWEDPLKCRECYPDDCLMETPLIETDKTSVVPTQLIGLKDRLKKEPLAVDFKYQSEGKIETLKDYFYYDHVERGSNHYQIYVRTANYYANYEESINDWLITSVRKKIKEDRDDKVLSFDVLVNPLHFSNAAFVESVNEKVFNGASYTLRIEVEKEFKDNVETKFSDLKLLYQKLDEMGISAEINIHYVDDGINLGGNITRMKHVVSSLFPHDSIYPNAERKIKVNIFKSVIVLINRLSLSSIRDYVTNANDYFYYLDIRISSMRTHEDACYLCKEADNSIKLSRASVSKQMCEYWDRQRVKYNKKSLHEAKQYKKVLENKDGKYYERCYRRILCAHNLNVAFIELGNEINNSIEVLKRVCKLILEVNDEDYIEMLMSYLYAYATPFISYRKSAREGVFTLIIILLEYLVMGGQENLKQRILNIKKKEGQDCKGEQEQCEYIEECIDVTSEIMNQMRKCLKEPLQKYELLKLLMKLSAELKSNYILREDRIGKIVNFVCEKVEDSDLNDFIQYYVALMKRILDLNVDESKSTRFDIILNKHAIEIIGQCGNKDVIKRLLIAMYLENTAGVRGIINNSKYWEKKDIDVPFYNLENYNNILTINDIEDDQFVKSLNKINNLFMDKESCIESDSKDVPFYKELCTDIAELFNARNVLLAVEDTEQALVIGQENKVVFANKTIYKVFGRYMERSRDANKIIEAIESSTKYILDTLSCDEKQNIAIIRYEIKLGGNENTKKVYLGIEFKDENESRIIQKLKFLLIFREQILDRLFNDFDNNILQEWIEKNRILEQLKKARSNTHTDENNIFDKESVWSLSEGFLYGNPEKIEQHIKDYGDKVLGCILGLMMNIRIGRSNVLLLSKGDFIPEEVECMLKFKYMKAKISALRNIYFYDKLRIVDEKGNVIGDEIFPDAIYDSYMAKGKQDTYCECKSYLLYFIFELFHSAVVNGKRDEGDRVDVIVYKEAEYLFLKNRVKDTFNPENIKRGLRREEAGISLATICEFFIYNYDNRFVKLIMDNEYFTIGLPIFIK